MLYELRRTPDARDASQAIVNKLASQRRPPAQRAKKTKPDNREQLSLFDEGGLEDRLLLRLVSPEGAAASGNNTHGICTMRRSLPFATLMIFLANCFSNAWFKCAAGVIWNHLLCGYFEYQEQTDHASYIA